MSTNTPQLRLVTYYLGRLGLPGLLGLAMLIGAVALLPGVILPAERQQEQLAVQAARAEAEASRLAALDPEEVEYSPAEQIYRFYKGFPGESDIPRWLEKIYELAGKSGVALESGEYSLQKAQSGRLNQYRITFPTKGAYPAIRKFIAEVLASAPAIALDSVRIKRENVGEGSVEARIVFILHLEAGQ